MAAADATRLAELDSTTTYRRPGQPYSGLGNTRAHQGLIFDAEIGSYNNRARQYAPMLKTFMQRDPLGLFDVSHARLHYPDEMNHYQYLQGKPLDSRDPSGLDLGCHDECDADGDGERDCNANRGYCICSCKDIFVVKGYCCANLTEGKCPTWDCCGKAPDIPCE